MNLWILVDNYGRIYYTGYTKELVELRSKDYNFVPNLQIIELKGEINV